jgi:hypothetical protein
MAWTIPAATDRIATLDEVLEVAADTIVDPHDLDSIAACAPALRALANDRGLMYGALNEDLVNIVGGKAKLFYSPQSLILRETAQRFTVRANIWPLVRSKPRSRPLTEKIFAYTVAHDHNFSFLTVGYHGPGYETTIYEYDYDRVEGYVGEKVDLRFLEHTRLEQGKVMLFRSGRDIHIQYPPEELTISLNLLVGSDDAYRHEQYAFDVDHARIADLLLQSGITNIVGYLRFVASFGGDGRTRELLDGIASRHANRNVRLAAAESAATLAPDAAERERIWDAALGDKDLLVRQGAARQISRLQAACGESPGNGKEAAMT